MKYGKSMLATLILSMIFILASEKLYAQNNDEPLPCTIELSNEKPLPYEPVEMLITITNVSKETQSVETYSHPLTEVKYIDSGSKWHCIHETGLIKKEYEELKPGETVQCIETLDYVASKGSVPNLVEIFVSP